MSDNRRNIRRRPSFKTIGVVFIYLSVLFFTIGEIVCLVGVWRDLPRLCLAFVLGSALHLLLSVIFFRASKRASEASAVDEKYLKIPRRIACLLDDKVELMASWIIASLLGVFFCKMRISDSFYLVKFAWSVFSFSCVWFYSCFILVVALDVCSAKSED